VNYYYHEFSVIVCCESLTSDPHHEHAEVGQVARHAEHGGLQVLLVSGQVDEGDDLGGLLTDLGPVQTAAVAVGLVDHLRGGEGGHASEKQEEPRAQEAFTTPDNK